jgi:PAS domain S-box-containing protein
MVRRIFERVSWVAAVTIFAIVLAGSITYMHIESLGQAASRLDGSQHVRFSLQRTLSIVQDAESAVRGYYITGEAAFLTPYSQARAQLDNELQPLRSLLANEPEQLSRLRSLDHLAHARLDTLDQTVLAIKQGNFVLPKAPVATSYSVQLMGSLRSLVETMQEEENRQLAVRSTTAERIHRSALVSVVGTSAIAATLVVLLVLVGRRASSAVRRSEQWLSTTLSSIGDGVITIDATGAVRFMNRVAAELTGWSQAEARGRALDEVFTVVGEDRQRAESPIARVLREGIPVSLPKGRVLVRRDRVEFSIEDSAAPIRGDDGRINGAVMVFRDATAARAARQALEASEERLRLALEGAELGAVDHDLRTNTAVWNERLYAIVGYPPDTPVTVEMVNLHTAIEDWERVQQELQHAKAAHVPFRCEHRIVRANDGAVRWVSSNGTYIYDGEGRGIRFIGVVRDITENRRLESQVRQAQKLDALGTLAGGIAHDFNNILAVLRGNLSLLHADLPGDHPGMPAVLDMEIACNRATALVRQILTFGRRQEQDREVLHLDEVVREGVLLLRATLPAEIDIRASYAAGLPPVLVDPNQIHQVITNLGINAAHAIGRRAGVIDIQLDSVHVEGEWASTPDLHEGHYVRLKLSDDGSGMSREVMDRIFEPFFTTKAPHGGTGLGLSVVRGILKNHDAAISVYSEPGRGTRFHLYFPAVEDKAHGTVRPVPVSKRGRGEHILYLDDEESLVHLAKRMLERMGYRVSGFSDSTEALAAFAAAPEVYDLVLTDLSMPGMSGMEVSRRMLDIRPDVPVLLATGYVRNEDVEQARLIGIRQVIWKPQTVGEMSDLLAQELEKLAPP